MMTFCIRFEVYTEVNILCSSVLGYDTLQSGKLMHLYSFLFVQCWMFGLVMLNFSVVRCPLISVLVPLCANLSIKSIDILV
jgi:hypothetical protein